MSLKHHLWAFLFCLPFMGHSQLLFAPKQVIVNDEKVAVFTSDVHAADVDGDGDLDVITASGYDHKVAWFEQKIGTETEWEHHVIGIFGYVVTSVDAADFDGDGDLDVLATVALPDKVIWFENLDGLGNFSGVKNIASYLSGVGLREAIAADIDGDGKLDVAAVFTSIDKVAWFRNTNGQGSFGAETIISTQTYGAFAVVASDLDGDGDLDLAVAASTDDIVWFENQDGVGSFGPQQLISANLDNAVDIFADDLDGDGDVDILSASKNDDKIAWYQNLNGQGSFGPQQIIASDADEANCVTTFDADGDGDRDVLATSYANNSVAFYENTNGLGVFGTKQPVTSLASGPSAVFAADLDNDGDSDVLAGSAGQSKLAWYPNSQGNFVGENIIAFSQASGLGAINTADVDSDGDKDILFTAGGTKIGLYKNLNGSGAFGSQQVILSNVLGARSVFTSDLDNDNDLDLLATAGPESTIGWYENTGGSGLFGSSQTIGTNINGSPSAYTADLDGDGDQDAIAAPSSGRIRWFENLDGQGSFGPEQFVSQVSYSYSIPADMDGDGDVDLCVAVPYTAQLVWLENVDGLGNFGPEKPITTQSSGTTSLFVADLDGDGDMDLLSSSENNPDKIAWYENEDGAGTFSTQKIITNTIDGAKYVYASDLDDDGDLDVLSASYGDDIIAWYENTDGQGNFGEKNIIYDAADNASSVITTDIDGDGDMDVLVAARNNNEIALFKNLLYQPSIKGWCFWDKNENKLHDPDEIGLLNQNLILQPNGLVMFTDPSGISTIFVDNGDYSLQVSPSTNWSVVTDSLSYEVSAPADEGEVFEFGLVPTLDITEVTPSVASAPTRCGFKVPFWLNVENTGTTYSSGVVSFEKDTSTSIESMVPQPDSTAGNLVFWFFENLAPSHSERIEMLLQMPGVLAKGNKVEFTARAVYKDENGDIKGIYTYTLISTINCAYDPNDKQVVPAGVQEAHLTLFGEELEYTVRFQNTGTDTAFTVRIEDQLDADLDWSTFKPVAASHDYRLSITETGLVEYLFENILLPDSTTNEPGSHGFFKYRIRPKNGLQENTQIHNFGDIYFDFNPPIRTNTTLNTLVSTIISATDDTYIMESKVFPNPFSEQINIALGQINGSETIQIEITDINGKLMQYFEAKPGTTTKINGDRWPSGVYNYKLKRKDEALGGGQLIKQ